MTTATASESVFERPGYWKGQLGYRPNKAGLGYFDFPSNWPKVSLVRSLDPAPTSVLDVGCAFGYVVRRLKAYGIDAQGVDISSYALSQASADVAPYLKQADVHDLPFEDGAFDVVFSSGVLEHARDPERAIAELVRVGRRGVVGVTCAGDPHADDDGSHAALRPLEWWRDRFPAGWTVLSDDERNWWTHPDRKLSRVFLVAPAVMPVRGDGRYGGIERLVYLFATELERRGFEVAVAAPSGSAFPKGVRYVDFGGPYGFGTGDEAALYRYGSVLLEGWDVVHDFSHDHAVGRFTGAIEQVAMVWHDPALMRVNLPKTNVAALSHWQADRLFQHQRHRARTLDVICAEPDAFLRLFDRDDPPFYVTLGRMHETKGNLESLEICSRAGVRCWVVGSRGPGDLPAYEERVRRRCAEVPGAEFLGEVSDQAKAEILGRASGIIYAPQYPEGTAEAHSHKLVEAMMAGCPALVLDRGALHEVVDEGVTGFVCGSLDAMRRRIPDLARLDREACRARAIERFGVANVVERWLPVYQEIMRGGEW